MQKLTFTNGNGITIDLTSNPFGITNWGGLSNTDLDIQTQDVPFQDGSVYLDSLLSEREISVTVAINDSNDLQKRYELKRQLISALNPKLGEGVLVYTNDFLSKQIKAIPQLPIFKNKNSNDTGTLKGTLVFTCCSPYWEDVNESTVILNSGKVSNIYNDGDINTPINVKLSASSIQNLSIKNLTTNKEIKLTDSFSNFINIETEVGKKEISNGNLNFELRNINVILYSSVIAGEYTYYCGANGTILRTKDGNNFESLKTGTTAILKKIIYAEDKNLLVAVGWNNTIITSSNGTTWVSINELSGTFEDACYSEDKSLFIAITNASTIYESSDGVTWTSLSVGSSHKLCIIYNEDLEKFFMGEIGAIYESSDGVTWTSSYSSSGKYFQKLIAKDNEVYCYEVVSRIIYRYNDSWAQISETTFTGSDVNLFYYDDFEKRFIISLYVSSSKPNVIYTSYDCKSFTEIYECKTIMNTICFNFGYYFCCGENVFVKTTYFKTFYDVFKSLNFLYACASSKKLNLTVFLNSSYDAYVLKDGKIENITLPTNSKINSVVYVEEKNIFIGVGMNSTIITSADGYNWVVRYENTKELTCIEYVDYLNQFIAVGLSGFIVTSSNAIEWTVKDIGYTTRLNSITYSNEKKLIVICGTNYCFTGYDLDNLERISLTGSNYSVCYNDVLNKFISVGNYIYYSNDGKYWVKSYPISGTVSLQKIRYIKEFNISIAIGSDGLIVYSYDSINWNVLESNLSLVLFDLCFFNNEILICGTYGNIDSLILNFENNIIDKLDSNSDLNFFLKSGRNEILLTSKNNLVSGSMSFRNKYIGV